MFSLVKRLGVTAVGGLMLTAVMAGSANAQAIPRTYPNSSTMIDPNPYLPSVGMRLNQYVYNQTQLNRIYSSVPPYMLGYNPYLRSVHVAPVYITPSYNPYYSLYSMPYNSGYGYGYGSYPSYPYGYYSGY